LSSNATPEAPALPPPDPATPAKAEPPLRSVHTSNFPAILQELGISVLVTTYQAGKLVMLQADDAKATRLDIGWLPGLPGSEHLQRTPPAARAGIIRHQQWHLQKAGRRGYP
jgi:hypothetical protein